MQVEHDNLAPTGTVRILVEMGFSEKLARKALDRTAWDVEAAADWCCMHMDEELRSLQFLNFSNRDRKSRLFEPSLFLMDPQKRKTLLPLAHQRPLKPKTIQKKLIS